MPIPQLRHDRNRVQTGVLSESGRDDLESFGKGLEAVGFHAFEGLAVGCEETGDVDLGGAATDD